MKNRIIVAIAVGLLVWGGIHAWGAYLYNHNPWRAVMVGGFMAAFLAFWLGLLAWHRRSRDDAES